MARRFSSDALMVLSSSLLEKVGLRRDRASVVAGVLLDADLLGHTTHGLALLPDYLGEIANGRMAVAGGPEVVAQSPSSLVWDGKRLPGPWLVAEAVRVASDRASEQGTYSVVIRRSHHIACLAAYLLAATERGHFVLIASSDPNTASVAPFGGRERLITPNPLAVGIPTGADPILIDISMSTTTNAMTARTRDEGRNLPSNWLLDSNGTPTSDPNVFFADPPGSILPLGGTDLGYKGFALGLLIEALTGGLAGFGRADEKEGWGASVFVQVSDPDRFGGRAEFERQMGWLANTARASAPVQGGDSVRLPGDRALALRRKQLAEGIELHPSILPRLTQWAQRLDVAMTDLQ